MSNTEDRDAFVERWAAAAFAVGDPDHDFHGGYLCDEERDEYRNYVECLLAEYDARCEVASMRAVVEAAVAERMASIALAESTGRTYADRTREAYEAEFKLDDTVDAYRARKP